MKLYVGNLSYDTNDAELRDLFAPYGEPESAKVITDRDTGRSKGFGFVEFADNAQATAAMNAFGVDGLKGLPSAPERLLRVDPDPFRPQPRRDRDAGDGMTVTVGRMRDEPVLKGVKYVVLSHNTKLGAGKGAVLLAEWLSREGYIERAG